MKILPRDPRAVMVVVFGRSRRPFNCSGGCVREVYARKYEKSVKRRNERRQSRGVFMIYTSCEPSRTYGVVLIFFFLGGRNNLD